MQVTCPQCQATYTLKAQIPPQGRGLKCAKCGHVWRVLPQGQPTAASAESTATPTEPQTPNPESQVPNSESETPIPPLDSFAAVKSTPQTLRQFGLSWFILLAAAALVAVGALGWWWLQQALSVAVPPSAPTVIHAKAIPPQPTGLTLSGLSHTLSTPAEATPLTPPTLTISGRVQNTTSATLTPPPLAVQVVTSGSIQLGRLAASLASPTLAPGQSTPFRASFPTLPLQKVASYRAFFLTNQPPR